MLAKIYRPAKSAMTSGLARTHDWMLEFAQTEPKPLDPLMGWVGSLETVQQVKLRFETREAAIDYAERHGIPYQVVEPKPRKPNVRPRGYGQNFATDRRQSWTH